MSYVKYGFTSGSSLSGRVFEENFHEKGINPKSITHKFHETYSTCFQLHTIAQKLVQVHVINSIMYKLTKMVLANELLREKMTL